MIAASLLHDIGHLLYNEEMAHTGLNDRHESLGAKLLYNLFGSEVSEPVKLHVQAKRYLCTIDSHYYASLSDASRESLEWQGGLLSASALRAFEDNPCFNDAVNLRQWDDLGKDPQDLNTDLSHYIPLLQNILTPQVLTA
jgi:predicted HD phosphohydrolase